VHTKDATHGGETSVRLNLSAAEDTVFTEAERAPLELAEQGTRIVRSNEARANAANRYDEDQLAGLVSLIALINAYNRTA
jgi:alkylhydroperoxidase family enzyme